ncbi:MAG: hypothetical protein RIS35_2397, partial [Pseudomonadota bacterium]
WIFANQIQGVLDLLSTLGVTAGIVLCLVAAAYLAVRWWRRRLALEGLSVPRIAVNELRALIDAGRAPVIVDVRSDAARSIDERRIPGALGIELGAVVERIVQAHPVDAELVLYCNCPNEASAADAAARLAAHGFTRVRALEGGLEAWVASGHAVEPHAAPDGSPAQAAPI